MKKKINKLKNSDIEKVEERMRGMLKWQTREKWANKRTSGPITRYTHYTTAHTFRCLFHEWIGLLIRSSALLDLCRDHVRLRRRVSIRARLCHRIRFPFILFLFLFFFFFVFALAYLKRTDRHCPLLHWACPPGPCDIQIFKISSLICSTGFRSDRSLFFFYAIGTPDDFSRVDAEEEEKKRKEIPSRPKCCLEEENKASWRKLGRNDSGPRRTDKCTVKEWRLILKIVVTWPVSLVLFVDICLPRLGRHLSTREKKKGKKTRRRRETWWWCKGRPHLHFSRLARRRSERGTHKTIRRKEERKTGRLATHTHTHRRGSLIIMPVASLGAGAAAPNKELWVPPPSTTATTTYLSSTLYKYRYYVMRCPSVRRPIRPARPPTTTLYAYLGFGWPALIRLSHLLLLLNELKQSRDKTKKRWEKNLPIVWAPRLRTALFSFGGIKENLSFLIPTEKRKKK